MINFPKQLISELADNLSINVKQFIDRDKSAEFPKQAVEDTLYHYLYESAQPDIIRQIMRNERKQRKRKKASWYNRVLKDFQEKDITTAKNPLFPTYLAYNSLSMEEKVALGWNMPIDAVLDKKLNEIAQWSNDDETYLIDFPCLGILTDKKVYDALLSDTFRDIYNYLLDKYSLNINSFQKIYTDTLIENPIFGEKKDKLNLEQIPEDNNTLVDKLMLTKDSFFYTMVKKDAAIKKSLGKQDLELIQRGIFNYITDSFYTERTVINKLRVFSQIMCSKPNKSYNKRAAETLLSYPDISYKAVNLKDNNTTKAYVLFDEIEIKNPTDFVPTPEEPYSADADVIVHFGNRLYQEIVQAQIIGITQDSYNRVNSELAHMLAPILQMQRTILTKELPQEKPQNYHLDSSMTKSYEYAFFASGVRLTGSKRNNIQKIKSALDEFVDAGIYIKQMRMSNNIFTITYYPLSEDELADIQINTDTKSPKQLSMMDIIEGN